MPQLSQSGPQAGGAVVQRGAGANMSVDVAAGSALVANVEVAFTAGNLAITTADATQDRTDVVVVNSSGTKSVLAGPVNDGANAQPPDTTGYAPIAFVYVYSQANPLYSGTIVTADVTPATPVILVTGQLSARTVYTTGSGTHTFQAATTTIRLIVVGSGGGGANAQSCHVTDGSCASGGGGGGGTCDSILSLGANTSLTYAVGAAGTGGSGVGVVDGGDGGDSTAVLGATTYTGIGGKGGKAMAAQILGTVVVNGGAGGGATNGNLNIVGSAGGLAFHLPGVTSTTPGLAIAGNGGASQWGGGGIATSGSGASNGTAGGIYGGGGSGATSIESGTHAGGDGGVGCVIVEEYT